ncbi:MAG: hypothetical protein KDA80_12500 [Planctomycetaceae bacterium]|nr:hypothetical protein [Planctomycetaceae bacterium]
MCRTRRFLRLAPIFLLALLLQVTVADSERLGDSQIPDRIPTQVESGPAQRDSHGIMTQRIVSPRQSTATEIRVLLPDPVDSSTSYPVVYLLPVEAGRGDRYGDPLMEILKQKLHQKYAVIFVSLRFAELPWYADHPTRGDCRQESYFLKDVIPTVEANFPTRSDAKGRLLLGFSKSGWGAWSLFLRHPDTFGAAVAWDAPLMMSWPSRFGSQPIFETEENFRNYQLSSLVRQRAKNWPSDRRLIHLGYGNFQEHHQQMELLLEHLAVPHVYRDGPHRSHDWHSGWVEDALQELFPREAP